MSKPKRENVVALLSVLMIFVLCFSAILLFSGYFDRLFRKGTAYTVSPSITKEAKIDLVAVYCSTTNYYPESDSTEVIGITNDGQKVSLFTISFAQSPGFHPNYQPKALLHDSFVAVYFDGRQANEQTPLNLKGDFIRQHSSYAPKLYLFDLSTGTINDIKLPTKYMSVLDVFYYDDSFYFLGESYHALFNMLGAFSSETAIYKFDTIKTKKVINLKMSIVKESPLAPKGTVANDEYFFPTQTGIYKANLKTKTIELFTAYDYSFCEEVELQEYLGNIIAVSEKYAISYEPNYVEEHSVFIQKYSETGELSEEIIFDSVLSQIYWGEDSCVLGYYLGEATLQRTLSAFLELNFDTFELTPLDANKHVYWVYWDSKWTTMV